MLRTKILVVTLGLAAIACAAPGCKIDPYGPIYTGTHEELAAVDARRQAAEDERAEVEWWQRNDDPAWRRDQVEGPPTQARWLTALEQRIVSTMPHESGGATVVMANHLDYMTWRERLEYDRYQAAEDRRDRRGAYGGVVVAHSVPRSSSFAHDGNPGESVYERHAWRINYGFGNYWWMYDERTPVQLNATRAQLERMAAPAMPAKAAPADKPTPSKKPAAKKPAAKAPAGSGSGDKQ